MQLDRSNPKVAKPVTSEFSARSVSFGLVLVNQIAEVSSLVGSSNGLADRFLFERRIWFFSVEFGKVCVAQFNRLLTFVATIDFLDLSDLSCLFCVGWVSQRLFIFEITSHVLDAEAGGEFGKYFLNFSVEVFEHRIHSSVKTVEGFCDGEFLFSLFS